MAHPFVRLLTWICEIPTCCQAFWQSVNNGFDNFDLFTRLRFEHPLLYHQPSTIIYISINYLLNLQRELDGYKFPVFTTVFCPRNISEWNKRASAFNCTVGSTYACFPNNNISELIEFCYPYPVIPISKGRNILLP